MEKISGSTVESANYMRSLYSAENGIQSKKKIGGRPYTLFNCIICSLGRQISTYNGYTLLETLIAFIILMIIVIPFIGYLFRISAANDAEMNFTALCLLEQESAIVRTFHDKRLPIKRKMVNSREWIITTEVSGSGLLLYTMTVTDGKKKRGEVVFYGRE